MINTIRVGTMEYLASDKISVAHGFTTRLGGVSTGVYASLNFGLHREDDPENVAKNHEILSKVIGFDPKKLVMSHQTHTDIVRVVTAADALGIDHHSYPISDGLVTNDPGVALWIFTADCTPILLHDPVTGAVGAVHAGWRGTASGIAAKAVAAMVQNFGSNPAHIRCAIGPNIGKCCFETDDDVPKAMLAALGDSAKPHIVQNGNKYFVDLKAINALHLQRAGVESIDICPVCTACNPDRFWSHRVTKGIRGSQGAIVVREDTV